MPPVLTHHHRQVRRGADLLADGGAHVGACRAAGEPRLELRAVRRHRDHGVPVGGPDEGLEDDRHDVIAAIGQESRRRRVAGPQSHFDRLAGRRERPVGRAERRGEALRRAGDQIAGGVGARADRADEDEREGDSRTEGDTPAPGRGRAGGRRGGPSGHRRRTRPCEQRRLRGQTRDRSPFRRPPSRKPARSGRKARGVELPEVPLELQRREQATRLLQIARRCYSAQLPVLASVL